MTAQTRGLAESGLAASDRVFLQRGSLHPCKWLLGGNAVRARPPTSQTTRHVLGFRGFGEKTVANPECSRTRTTVNAYSVRSCSSMLESRRGLAMSVIRP